MMFTWKAGYTNTAAMTLNVADTAATGAKSVKTTNGSDPWAGAVTVGGYYTTIYDGTNHILMNPSPLAQPGPASTTQSGIVELATDAETQSLSDATRAVTSSNLGALAASTTQRGIVELATDAEAITGTDSTRAVPPSALKSMLVESPEYTITAAAVGTWTHGLGAAAQQMQAWVRCNTAIGGWAAGDELLLAGAADHPGSTAVTGIQLAKISATQIKYAIGSGIYVINSTNGSLLSATSANFTLFFRAKPY
jgi:hypothetical protein